MTTRFKWKKNKKKSRKIQKDVYLIHLGGNYRCFWIIFLQECKQITVFTSYPTSVLFRTSTLLSVLSINGGKEMFFIESRKQSMSIMAITEDSFSNRCRKIVKALKCLCCEGVVFVSWWCCVWVRLPPFNIYFFA